MSDTSTVETTFLKNLWDEREAARLESQPLELLRYRSNLLGADLRITNFGGGNTSSKFDLPDPLTGEPTRVMAVKGSGGDLRSIGTSGFAVLYLDKLESLIARYRGEAFEDEMVGFYPLLRVRREPRRGLDRHAAARVPAVPSRRPPASRLGDRARGERQRQGQARGVQPEVRPQDRLGAVAAARLRAGADAAQGGRGQSRLRRHHPRRPRPVHLGRDAARVLLQQHQDHRPDGRVRPGPREARRPAAVRRRHRRDRRRIASRSSARCCRTCAAPCRRTAASSRHYDSSDDALGLRQLAVGGGALPDGHQLSRITSCAPASRRCTWRGSRKTGSRR